MATRHPAPFPKYVLDRVALWLGPERRALGRPLRILDPMCGIGRVHDLPRRLGETVGVDLEPEWANQRAGSIVGDATALPDDWTETFDAVVVSPVYGNRMSDHHEAKDSCGACGGIGVEISEDGCADAPMFCSACGRADCVCGQLATAMRTHNRWCRTCRKQICPACKGAGVSLRYTYRHALGRPLSPNNAGQMHWPSLEYRTLHKSAWAEAWRVLRVGGLIVVNVKNFLATKNGVQVEQHVSEWHEQTLREVGFRVDAVDSISAKGLRHAGTNGSVRATHENLIIGRKVNA